MIALFYITDCMASYPTTDDHNTNDNDCDYDDNDNVVVQDLDQVQER